MADDVSKWLQKMRLTSGKLVTAIVVIVLVILAAGSFYQVDQTERTVITRFGKYDKTAQPGLHFKLPWIDKKYTVPANDVVLTEQFGFQTLQGGVVNTYLNKITSESTMLTGDLNIVDAEWTIQYHIVDPYMWLFNVENNRKTIRDISQSVVNMLVGDRAILEIMGQERNAIERAAVDQMNENFERFELGIKVQKVALQNIVAPQGVQAAFEDVNKSTQDMERFTNEGREAYNTQVPRAEGERLQILQQAQGYAIDRVNRARGDVARFNAVYEEYRQAPAITRQRLYLETMENIFNAKKGQTLIDGELDNVIPFKNITGGN